MAIHFNMGVLFESDRTKCFRCGGEVNTLGRCAGCGIASTFQDLMTVHPACFLEDGSWRPEVLIALGTLAQRGTV